MKTAKQSKSRISSITIVLSGAVALLGAGLWHNLYAPIDVSPEFSKTLTTKPVANFRITKEPEAIQLSQYVQTASRPLFNADRRPFSAEQTKKKTVKKVVKRQPAAVSFKLLGVLINEKMRKALIGSHTADKGRWASQGVILNGWKVKAIHQNKVILERGGSARELPLYANLPKR